MQELTHFVPLLLLIITALLAILGFFLKQLYQVIQGLTNSVNSLQLSLESVKIYSKTNFELLKQITDEHGKRIDRLQTKVDHYDKNITDFWRRLPDAIKQQMNES